MRVSSLLAELRVQPILNHPTFKDQKVKKFLDSLSLEDGTDRLSRNIGKGLPLDAA
jgi:hypothetical protein